MIEILEVRTEGGEALFFEMEGREDKELRAGVGALVNKSRETLESILSSVRPFAIAVRRSLEDVSPDEIEFEFGVRLGIEGGLLFVKNATEGSFRITIKWKGEAPVTHGE
jgi:hypothetical protein